MANALLDYSFDDEYGATGSPIFIAQDSVKLYFPAFSSQSMWIESVFKDVNKYLDPNNTPPYVGK